MSVPLVMFKWQGRSVYFKAEPEAVLRLHNTTPGHHKFYEVALHYDPTDDRYAIAVYWGRIRDGAMLSPEERRVTGASKLLQVVASTGDGWMNYLATAAVNATNAKLCRGYYIVRRFPEWWEAQTWIQVVERVNADRLSDRQPIALRDQFGDIRGFALHNPIPTEVPLPVAPPPRLPGAMLIRKRKRLLE